MTKTYAQVIKQIETLTQEAEKLRRDEVEGVVKRMKQAIEVYKLTAEDLGLMVGKASGAKTRAAGAKREKAPAGKPAFKRKSAGIVRFRDDAGNKWTGFGPKPKWLREALASGKDIKEFTV